MTKTIEKIKNAKLLKFFKLMSSQYFVLCGSRHINPSASLIKSCLRIKVKKLEIFCKFVENQNN